MTKKLPIGISDFKKIREEGYYYIDKSLFIKEVIDSAPEVILLPRPRRFGKTLNISMLKYYFEKGSEDHSNLFHDLKIWQTGEPYTSKQGTYPVIFLTFKDSKDSNWTNSYNKMKRAIITEYRRHLYILDTLNYFDRESYIGILRGEATQDAYEDSLRFLSNLLNHYHQKKVFILVDEYDIPIESGYMEGYYKEITSFMRNLLSGGLKDNTALEKGILTGILRVAKESIFSGLNNLAVYGMLQPCFKNHFGLIEDEVLQSLGDYEMSDKFSEVKEWYNGYQFGGSNVYNPWSILQYIGSKGVALPYWVNTGGFELLTNIITKDNEIKEGLQILMGNEVIQKEISENIVYGDIEKNSDTIWSFLLFTGYLTTTNSRVEDGRIFVDLQIPNKEILFFYKKVVRTWFDNFDHSELNALLDSLRLGNIGTFELIFKKFVENMLSMFDFRDDHEAIYHAFVLGMLVYLNDEYKVQSNRESGYGRYDVSLIPRIPDRMGVIFEFKKVNNEGKLDEGALEALHQIENRHYHTDLFNHGINDIMEIGIAFYVNRFRLNQKKLVSNKASGVPAFS